MVEAVVVGPHAAPAPVVPASSPVAAPPATPPPNWREGLPPDIAKSVEKYETSHAAAQGYHELSKKLGQKFDGMVKVPVEGAPAEEVTAFDAAVRKAQGVPADAAGYTFTVAEDLKALVPEPALAHFKPLFHQLGIPPKSAQAIVQGFAEFSQAQLAALHQGYDQKLQEMKNEYGVPTWDYRAANAKFALEDVIGRGEGGLGPEWLEEFKGTMETTKLGSHPAMVKLFMWLGQQFREDGHAHGQLTGTAMTTDQMTARKAAIMADPDFFVAHKNPAKNAALKEEYAALMTQLNPQAIR